MEQPIPEELELSLKKFCGENRLGDLYRAYSWGDDSWGTGFIDILKIERQLRSHLFNDGITLDDVKDIARWGKLRNPGKIKGNSVVLTRNTIFGTENTLVPHAASNPLAALQFLRENIETGIGPTYFTKTLRFAAPSIYGAIDTRCVRVFGRGDPASQKHEWIGLHVKDYGYGWFIPERQKNWPKGYFQWLGILKTICSLLPANCPHPPAFVEHGLREKGVWTCADVEMALFTYASKQIKGEH